MALPSVRSALAELATVLGRRGVALPAAGGTQSGSELLGRVPVGEEQPWFVARPESVADIQACVRCANDLGIPVSVISGGHSPYSIAGKIVVDLQTMNSVKADRSSGTVTVGGGAVAADIVEAAAEQHLMIPLGTAPTVGLGLVLQGGLGHLTRFGGLSLDRLVSAQVVVADGRCLTVSASEHRELLWALSGCGPNFGIVTSATLSACELRPFTAWRHIFLVPDTSVDAAQLLEAYGSLSSTLPRTSAADCILHYGTDKNLKLGVFDYHVHGVGPCVHDDPGAGAGLSSQDRWTLLEKEVEPCLEVRQLFNREPYLLPQPRGTLLPEGPEGLGLFVRAVFLPAPLTAQMAQLLIEGLQAVPCHHCYIIFQHAGGAVADRSAKEAAFPSRALEWSAVITGCWPKPDTDGLEKLCVEWVFRVVKSLLPCALGTYATDLGPQDAELAQHTFGDNLEELLRLKAVWDPNGIFCCGFPLSPALRMG